MAQSSGHGMLPERFLRCCLVPSQKCSTEKLQKKYGWTRIGTALADIFGLETVQNCPCEIVSHGMWRLPVQSGICVATLFPLCQLTKSFLHKLPQTMLYFSNLGMALRTHSHSIARFEAQNGMDVIRDALMGDVQ